MFKEQKALVGWVKGGGDSFFEGLNSCFDRAFLKAQKPTI